MAAGLPSARRSRGLHGGADPLTPIGAIQWRIFPEQADRLIHTRAMPPAVIAFPDAFTKLAAISTSILMGSDVGTIFSWLKRCRS